MTITDTHIPPGYKLTEVGVIPTDWEIDELGSIAKITMGQSPQSLYYNSISIGYGLPLIQGNADVKNRKTIIRNYTSQITKKGKKGDIIMSVRAPVGEISKTYFDCCLGRGVCSIDFPNNYLYHLLIYLENYRVKLSTGSTFDSVNGKQIKELKLSLPKSLKEQTLIATALSDIDTLITELDTLIIKKTFIKSGTMQLLLTGKKRLPGCSGEWEMKKLGDVCDLQNGFAFKSSFYDEKGEWNIITIANVQEGKLIIEGTNKIFSLPKDIQKHQILEFGDMLISMTGNVGRICLVDKQNCLLNQRVGKLGNLKIDKFYFYYAISTRKFIKSMTIKAQGGAQGNLGKWDILDEMIHTPTDIEEQQAIASILSDIDTEIQSLQIKKDKYTNIKQGMMQSLLTGQIRLI